MGLIEYGWIDMDWMNILKNKQIVIPTTKISQRKEPVEEEEKDCCEQAMQKWISGWKEMAKRNLSKPEVARSSLIYLPDEIKGAYSKPCFIFYSVLRNGEQQTQRRMTTMWPQNLWDFTNITLDWDLESLLYHNTYGIGDEFRELCAKILDEWEDCNIHIPTEARKYFREGD
jgi:hypothetical protein